MKNIFPQTRGFFVIILAVLTLTVFILPPRISSAQKKAEEIKQSEPEKKTTEKASKKRKQEKKFALNFNDVDINEFLRVMGQLIGKNIVVHDRVKGKITITSAKKIPVSQAYEVLKSILEVKGFAVVETRNLIKVIPVSEAIKKNVEVIIDGKKTLEQAKSDNTVTFLLQINNADSNELLNTLRQLKTKDMSIVAFPALNTLIFSGSSAEINGLVKIAKELDKQPEGEKVEGPRYRGNINVIHLENANAEELAAVLSRVPFSESAKIDTTPLKKATAPRPSSRAKQTTSSYTPAAASTTKLSIIANKDTNSLIITASPEEFREIKRIIKELDIVREQVLIEALIIEVNASSGWGFGIDWMVGEKYGSNIYGGSSIMGSIPSYSNVNGKSIAVPLSSGFQLGFVNDSSILGFALLNATATDENFKILSTPQILTVDNHEAEINVGEDIPVPTNNRISDSGTQFYTYDYKPVGVKLKITPHITQKKRITLDLYQEVNSVLGETQVLESGSLIPPTLGKRDIKTKVTVFDGKTIVVGGLIRNDKTITESKVPILGDIPLLGWFFKRKSESFTKTNLLIFITPHIVTKQDRIDAITEQKRNLQHRMRSNQGR